MQANTIMTFFEDGKEGSQNATFDQVVILNAQDLVNTSFACVFDTHMNASAVSFSYSSDQQTLSFDTKSFNFTRIRQISFGSSQSNDLNLCQDLTYQYSIKDKIIPDLTKSPNITLTLSHMAGILPDLNISLSVGMHSMVNVKWTYAQLPEGWKKPFEVPETIAVKMVPGNLPLSNYVSISDTPFNLQIKNN